MENLNDSIQNINQDMERGGEYCKNNILRLNEGKCEFIILGSKNAINRVNNITLDPIIINAKPIKRVQTAKYLGLTFDEVLSWNKQVNLCISRAISKFKQFSNCKNMLSMESKKIFCDSMVLSQFNYADIVYMNMNKITQNKIEKIQNICIRYIFNVKKSSVFSITEHRKKLGWLSMSERRASHGLTLMFKIVNGLSPNYLSDLITFTNEVHNVNTRSSGGKKIWISKDIKAKSRRSAFIFSMSTLYNNLPENITNSKNVEIFKNKIKKLLSEKTLNLPDHFL